MLTSKIDRRRQNDRPAAGRFRETGEKIIAGHARAAMSDCSQEFLKIFSAQRPPMLLIAKHHRLVKIKYDAAIGPLQQAELDFIKTDRLEKNDHIMAARFFQNAQTFGYARAPRRSDRRFHPESGIGIETIAQPQPRARGVTMFNDTKYFHAIGAKNVYRFLACHSSG